MMYFIKLTFLLKQMAALELHDIEGRVSEEAISKAIAGLEQPLQKVICFVANYTISVTIPRTNTETLKKIGSQCVNVWLTT